MGSIPEVLTVVPIHRRPDLIEACADLINEEWKRSQASRIHSLQKSCDDFPVCLVLIKTWRETQNPGEEVKINCQLLGHARLSRVLGQPKSLFVESVVISKQFRGKGHGRKLMEASEGYASSRGFKQLHLTTHDKQPFYAHLGYVLSEPVQSVGAMTSFISMEFLQVFCKQQPTRTYASGPEADNSGSSSFTVCSSISSPPPPPDVHSSSMSPPPLSSLASAVSHVSSMGTPPLPSPPPLPHLSSHASNMSSMSPPPPLPMSHSAPAYVCSMSPPPPPPLPVSSSTASSVCSTSPPPPPPPPLPTSSSMASSVCSMSPPPPPLPTSFSTASTVCSTSPPSPPPPPLPMSSSTASSVCSTSRLPPPPPPPPVSTSACYVSPAGSQPPASVPVLPGMSSHISPDCQLGTCELDTTNREREKSLHQTLLETPHRDLRGLPIFWMKKNI